MKTVNDPIFAAEPASTGAYYGTYVALIVLLVATFALARVDLGVWHTPTAFLIATMKAALVMWYFMHVRSEQKLVLMLFGGALVLLGIAALLTMADYLTRA